ncbi:hypothetical protein ACERK3_16365 [Phycisphaerales bacterium AB-hyl4]|uniref:Uncharacterized protein n=1 Tax=Natronomicrosphaera hydrolytica TaxID=3242702 RepID=A0ABV4UBQ6_9BACT
MHLEQDPRLNLWYRRVSGRPGWVWTAALGAAVLVVLLPLVLLTLAAVIVATAVFATLSLVVAGMRFVNRLLGGGGRPGDDAHQGPAADLNASRRNVRVIERP